MAFKRPIIRDGGMERPAQAGDASPSNYVQTVDGSDANTVLNVSEVLGGLLTRGSLTVLRTLTLPTAVDLLAALDGMNVGDTISMKVANISTQTLGLDRKSVV